MDSTSSTFRLSTRSSDISLLVKKVILQEGYFFFNPSSIGVNWRISPKRCILITRMFMVCSTDPINIRRPLGKEDNQECHHPVSLILWCKDASQSIPL